MTLVHLTTLAQQVDSRVCFTLENYGQTSNEYQDALSEFADLWHRLKASRPPEDFLPEVGQSFGRNSFQA